MPHKDASTPVNVVPMFAHMIIATDDGKSMMPALIAAKVITPTALLDCIMAVTMRPITKNKGSQP